DDVIEDLVAPLGTAETRVCPDACSQTCERGCRGIVDHPLDDEAVDDDLVRLDLEGAVGGTDPCLAGHWYGTCPGVHTLLWSQERQRLVDRHELGVDTGTHLNSVAGSRRRDGCADRHIAGV